MKNLEIPKAVLDLLDYDMMPEGMHEQMEKEYVEMKTGVGSWAGDSVIVRRVQNQLKDLGMAVLAAEAGYAVIVAAPEQLNADAQEVLDRYKTMFTVIAGKDSMKQAMEKAKELGMLMVVESETLTPSGLEEARICMDYLKTME